jgi:hypothetical protein
METFRVYFICEECPYTEVEAEDEEDALDQVIDLYDSEDIQCFTSNGRFIPQETILIK